MDFKKFFPLINKNQPVDDQSLVNAFNQHNDSNIEDSSELLGIEQNPPIPFRPEPLPESAGQSISEEKTNRTKQSIIPEVNNNEPFKAISLASKLKNSYGPESQATAPEVEDEQQPAVKTQPSAPDFMSLLQNAQQGQIDNTLVNNMLKAGQTIGSALSRTGAKPDYSVADSLQAQAGQGVENVLQQMKSQKDQIGLNDENKLRDPTSDVSKAFRSTLVKLGIPHTEKTTAWDAKAMGINPQNLLMQREAREQAREMKELMLGDRSKAQAYSAVEAGIRNARNGAAYKAYSNTLNAQDALENALLTGDKVAAGTAFLRAAKVAQGDDSVVRSDDMKVLLGGVNYSPKAFAERMQDISKGKNITDRELNAMKNIMAMVKEKEGQKVYQQMSPHLNKINESGLDLASHFDPSELEELSRYAPKVKEASKQPASEASTTGMVKVTRISDGASKMMTAEQAARADKSKYTVGN